MADSYDVVVVGAGPAGYVCAIRCAQLGLSTACVDNLINKQGKPALGGTCLNFGCIPSKELLESSQRYYEVQNHPERYGIQVGQAQLDVPAMVASKDKTVTELTQGIESLFKSNSIDWLQGSGQLQADHRVGSSRPRARPTRCRQSMSSWRPDRHRSRSTRRRCPGIGSCPRPARWTGRHRRSASASSAPA